MTLKLETMLTSVGINLKNLRIYCKIQSLLYDNECLYALKLMSRWDL